MLKLLRHITQEVHAASTLEQALAIVVKQVSTSLEADACSVFLCDNVQGEYVLMATQGLNAKLIGKARLKFGEGLVGLVGEREEPINLADAPAHLQYYHYEELGEEDYHGFLGIPIIEQSELLGVLLVQQRQARCFAEEEEAFCVTLAIQLAVEISHAHAKGALQRLDRRRKKSPETVLDGVSGASGVAIGKAVVF